LTRFKLLAVDVDGTLLGAGSRLSGPHGAAVRLAKQAGLSVCLCTGRSVAETHPVWRACEFAGKADPLVCISGALVCESNTVRTLRIEPINPAAAAAGARAILHGGRSVVALVDGWRWGFDYYFLEGADAVAVRAKWLDRHECRVKVIKSLEEAPEPAEILRLTAFIDSDVAALRQSLAACADGQLQAGQIFAPNLGAELLECFAPAASKWAGIAYVAQGLRIARRDIAAVGDDVNDLPLLQNVGLPVAMGNACPAVKAVAKITIGRHDEDGLAPFIEQLVAGAYE
jgi:5-amino-6-(5-phospho-D-ribitylamino)uracil phosphatase